MNVPASKVNGDKPAAQMTKLEVMSALALQGLLANRGPFGGIENAAIEQAVALLEALAGGLTPERISQITKSNSRAR